MDQWRQGRCHPGRQLRVSPLFFLKKTDGFLVITITFIDLTRVSPLVGVTRTFFYLSDLVCTLFYVNSPTIFFRSGVIPLEGVTRGGQPPPLP